MDCFFEAMVISEVVSKLADGESGRARQVEHVEVEGHSGRD